MASGTASGMASGTASTDAGALLRLLRSRTDGEPPRRVVVVSGGALCDRVDAPAGSTEVESMSAVCEVVRRMAGLPVWSRDSTLLVQQCLNTNNHGAWRALYSDVKTGDVDWSRAQVMAGGGMRVCVGCLMAPRDATHLLHMSACMCAMIDADPGVRLDFSVALGRKLSEFVDVLMRHSSVMRRDARDGVLASLGRLLAGADVPVADAAAALARVLDCRHDDLVRLFTHLPIAEFVGVLPDLVPKLVARARAASASSQYGLLAALVRVGAATPKALLAHQPEIVALVSGCLSAQLSVVGNMDARTVMVCGMLAGATGPASASLAPLLARALQRTAAVLVEK